MNNQTLFDEQRNYLRQQKDAIFGEFKGAKIGFDLYLPMKLSYYILFTLRKKYTIVHEEIETEKFVIDEFSDVLDALIVSGEENFSLKESLKAEAKLNVVTDYMMSIRKKKVYPSEIRRKESSLHNTTKRARKVIDDYFKNDDVHYQELFPVIDIYEVVVQDRGKHVDFHFGRHGFTLTDRNTEALRAYLAKEKAQYADKLSLVTEAQTIINQLATAFTLPPVFNKWLENPISAYAITSKSFEDFVALIEKQTKGMKQLHRFLSSMKRAGNVLPSNILLQSDYETIVIDGLHLSTALDPSEFFHELEEYRKINGFIETVTNACNAEGLVMQPNAKNGLFFLKGVIQKTQQSSRSFEDVSLQYRFENGKMYRLSGEEIYTPDAMIFEFMEHVRRADERAIATMKRAKEMLLSTLSDAEEQLFREKGVTIVEGEQNYYALVATQCHTNVVKIPKVLASMDDIKALCIHPANRNIPMFDGFASIALSVKSGDEGYVLKNSNEFRLGETMKEKLKEAMAIFEPLRHVQLT